MGVQELPDGEPPSWAFTTVAAYAKAYIDWAIEKRVKGLEERLAQLTPPETKR
jgi:hypothetical protein